MENCILYDWVSATIPVDGEYFREYGIDLTNGLFLLDVLGLHDIHFDISNGVRGYSKKLWFQGINIHLPSEAQPNVWLEMSGSGCRAFETYGSGDYDYLFSWLIKYAHLTRIDVSFDDHSGILDLDQMVNDTFFRREYVSKAVKHKLEMDIDDREEGSSSGCTIYHGSRQSNTIIRIYDKAKQLKREGEHWIRVELELHDENASEFIKLKDDLGSRWSGVLLNYLRYVDPCPSDSNRWRWPLKDYWSELVKAAAPIRLYKAPGIIYNIENLDHYVFNSSGNAIRTFISIFGLDAFLARLKETTPLNKPEKYVRLIEEFGGSHV